jgi:hypothetical protein
MQHSLSTYRAWYFLVMIWWYSIYLNVYWCFVHWVGEQKMSMPESDCCSSSGIRLTLPHLVSEPDRTPFKQKNIYAIYLTNWKLNLKICILVIRFLQKYHQPSETHSYVVEGRRNLQSDLEFASHVLAVVVHRVHTPVAGCRSDELKWGWRTNSDSPPCRIVSSPQIRQLLCFAATHWAKGRAQH